MTSEGPPVSFFQLRQPTLGHRRTPSLRHHIPTHSLQTNGPPISRTLLALQTTSRSSSGRAAGWPQSSQVQPPVPRRSPPQRIKLLLDSGTACLTEAFSLTELLLEKKASVRQVVPFSNRTFLSLTEVLLDKQASVETALSFSNRSVFL